MSKESNWLLMQGIRWTVRRFRYEWGKLPDQAWKRWLVTLTIGWVTAGLLAFLVAIGAERLSGVGLFARDPDLLRQIAAASPLSFASAMYLGVIGDSPFLFVLVPAAALVALWRGYPLRALSILATLFLTDIVVFVAWQTWNRARPDILYDGIAAPGLHSFPSGHMVQAIAVYGFLIYLWFDATHNWGERILAVLLCLLIWVDVGVTRLELGTHWPTDVLAAIPLGLVWLATLILALRQAEGVQQEVAEPHLQRSRSIPG